ncbi:MAG: TetR family transcriptional regulator [Nostoc sp.]|uniref:TetR family transcriptional regulator n=1 Tax=Nostoc sp. TaxID=1180 RepID=UPI002FFA0B53
MSFVTQGRDDVRSRLQQAALELYRERGYDQTTTAEIAACAGVTERTFFRYFPDKREVLFDGEGRLRSALTLAVAQVPNGLAPLAILFQAFRSVAPVLEMNRSFAKPRQQLIARTPALRERELAKISALTEALAEALRDRGVDNQLASLGAQIGMAAFVHAVASWLSEPTADLGACLDRALRELEALTADAVP